MAEPTVIDTNVRRTDDENYAPYDEFGTDDFDNVVFRRVVAYLVDLVIITVAGAVAIAVGSVIGVISLGLLWPLIAALISILPFAYHTLTIGSPASATVGMRIFGIEVRTWDGRRPGYIQAAVQTVLFYGSIALTSLLILLVVFFNKRNRTLHDFVAGTVIINSRD
ncbi:MAG: RDD family protein [Alphaproteobacteria bacterium]